MSGVAMEERRGEEEEEEEGAECDAEKRRSLNGRKEGLTSVASLCVFCSPHPAVLPSHLPSRHNRRHLGLLDILGLRERNECVGRLHQQCRALPHVFTLPLDIVRTEESAQEDYYSLPDIPILHLPRARSRSHAGRHLCAKVTLYSSVWLSYHYGRALLELLLEDVQESRQIEESIMMIFFLN